MNLQEAIKLTKEDKVFWTDPNGKNSRHFCIQTIVLIRGEKDPNQIIACILDKDGTAIECFIEDLKR